MNRMEYLRAEGRQSTASDKLSSARYKIGILLILYALVLSNLS